jgi:hypothetical protein
MVLQPVHIKIGLMENYAKALSRKISFAVPAKEFLQMSHVKWNQGSSLVVTKRSLWMMGIVIKFWKKLRRQRENPTSVFWQLSEPSDGAQLQSLFSLHKIGWHMSLKISLIWISFQQSLKKSSTSMVKDYIRRFLPWSNTTWEMNTTAGRHLLGDSCSICRQMVQMENMRKKVFNELHVRVNFTFQL